MVFAAITGISSVFGLTSCQDDDDFYTPTQQMGEKEKMDGDVIEIEPEDSLAVTDKNFMYDNLGTSSPSQYVEGFDYGRNNLPTNRFGAGEAFCLMKDIATYAVSNYKEILENPLDAVKFTLGKIFEEKEPDIMGELQTMQKQINEVEKILKAADGKLDNKEYANIYNERVKNLVSLRSANCTHLASYYEYMAKGDTDNANKVLDAWKGNVIHGNSVEYTVKEFLELTPQCNNMGQKSVTEVYDYWVFQTTPWEHMGYDKRDALRQGDILTAYAGYVLLKACYEKDRLVKHKTELCELNQAFKNFCEFYKGRERVERHDDRIVCQIKGANIVFQKNIKVRDMLNHPWRPDNSVIYGIEQFMYGDGIWEKGKKGKFDLIESSTVRKNSLTKDEAKAIYDYYNSEDNSKIPGIKNVKRDANGKYSLESIMKSAGFNLNQLEEGKKHVMTLNDDCHMENESVFNNNRLLFFNNVVLANDAENPFRSDWKVGVLWLIHKLPTQTKGFRDIFKHWDNYETKDAQYFYTNIEKRYTDMKPFN